MASETPIEVAIQTETIRLDQFLKWAGAVMTGGEAKQLIAAGEVRVDGATETRRGRSLARGARVEVEGGGRFQVA